MFILRKRRGFNVGRLDIIVGQEAGSPESHDFLSTTGFLSCAQFWFCRLQLAAYAHVHEFVFCLRVACFAVLQLAPGCIGLIAPDCRSWGTPSRGTSWRTFINVLGLNGRDFVHCGNLMASRTLGLHAAYMNSSMLHVSLTHSCMHFLTKGLFTYPQPTCVLRGGAAPAKPPIWPLSLAVAPRTGLLGDFAMPKWRTACMHESSIRSMHAFSST